MPQKWSVYIKPLITYGIGPLLMFVSLIILSAVADYLIDIIATGVINTDFWYLFAFNAILFILIPIFYYIGIRIGNAIFPLETQVVYASDTHKLIRSLMVLVAYTLSILFIIPFFIESIIELVSVLFYTDWETTTIFSVLTYFVDLYILIFISVLIAIVLQTILQLFVDVLAPARSSYSVIIIR